MAEEITNPFTFPPSQYRRYTKRNLVLLDTLRSRSSTQLHDPIPLDEQARLLSDQGDPIEWDLTQLERPRVDWIWEDGGYEAFGDPWPLPERPTKLAEYGVQQLYPDAQDHRPALHKLLRTVVSTYQEMLGSLLVPPVLDPNVMPQEPEYVQHIQWIGTNATNMAAAINELRPVQARATLESAMLKQLNTRREVTSSIHSKCDEIEAQLASLQQIAGQAAELSMSTVPSSHQILSKPSFDSTTAPPPPLATERQMEDWFEEVLVNLG